MKYLRSIIAALLLVPSIANAQTQVFSSSFVANSAGNANLSYRQAVPSISAGGATVSVTFNSTPTGAFAASHVAICIQSSGYNCVSAPVELTFGGASGFNIGANGASLSSDFVNLPTSVGQTLLVIIDVASANMPRNSSGPSGWDSFPNSATSWNVASPPAGWNSFTTTYGFTSVSVNTPHSPPPSTSLTAPGLPGGGRLTIAHGVSRLYQDAVASFVDYAPDVGTTVPMIGSTGAMFQQSFVSGPADLTGLTLNLDSTWTSGSIHDLYLALNASSPVLCSVAWSSGAVPSIADALVSGARVNGGPIPACRTSPSASVFCPVNQCTLLGSFKISSVAGVVKCDLSAGLSRECGIWNKDNQIDGILKVTDLTTPPYHVTTTFNNPNQSTPNTNVTPVANNPAFSGTIISGRPSGRPYIKAALNHRGLRLNNEALSSYQLGLGWNSTSVFCGDTTSANNYSRDSLGVNATMNQEYYGGTSGLQIVIAQTLNAWCDPLPFQGIGTATLLELQAWYSGEEWIDSGDVMMSVKFRY